MATLEATWFTNEDLAARYKVSVNTVRTWRRERTGPRGHRLGRHVRYSPTEVAEWESARADSARQS